MADEIKTTIEIVANLAQVQAQLRVLENDFKSSFGKIQSIAGTAFGTLGVGLSTAGLIAFAKEVAHTGGTLQDLSEKTGISGQALSAIKPIAEQNSSSIEAFANAMTRAVRGIADSGDQGDKARAEFLKLGFTLDELANISAHPEQGIQRLTEKIAGIENPGKRAAATVAIFGKTGADQIPVFNALIEKIRELGSFEKLKLQGIDEKTLADLKKLDDSLVSIKNSLVKIAATPLAGIAAAIRQLTGTSTEREKAVDELNKLSDQATRVAEQIRTAQAAREKGSRAGIASDEIFNRLLAQRKELIEKIAETQQKLAPTPAAATTPAAPIESDKATKAATAAALNFTESIDKEINKLHEQNLAFFQGADAAKAFGLEQDLLIAKEKVAAQLAAENVPKPIIDQALNKAFASIDIALLTAKLKAGREQIIAFAEVLAQNPADFAKFLKTKELDELPGKLEAVINRIKEAQAAAPTGTLLKLDTTAIDAELDKAARESKTFADIFGTEFDRAQQDANDLRATIEKLVRELKLPADSARIVELKARFDQKEVDAAVDDLNKKIQAAEERSRLLPFQSNPASDIVSARQGEIDRLLPNPSAGARGERERQAGLVQLDQIRAVSTDLDKQLETSARQAQALGTAFELPGEQAQALSESIKKLISDGLDRLPEGAAKVRELKAELNDARTADIFAKGLESSFDVIDRLIDGQIRSWRDLGKAIENVVGGVAKDILKLSIKNAINDSGILNNLGGIVGGASVGKLPAPLPADTTFKVPEAGQSIAFPGLQQGNVAPDISGGAGAIESVASTAQAAMEAQSSIIETTITGLETELSTAIQAELTLATTGIEGVVTTGTAAIAAVQAAAIAAIAAAGAGQAASNAGGGILEKIFSGASNLFQGSEGTYHQGGEVTHSPAVTRSISASAFYGARRYHRGTPGIGLRTNEVAAILEVGEKVFPRGARVYSQAEMKSAVVAASRYEPTPFFTGARRFHTGTDYVTASGSVASATQPWSGQAGSMKGGRGGNTIINLPNANFADRASASEQMQRLGRTVNTAMARHM
jgi:hypothetical protein